MSRRGALTGGYYDTRKSRLDLQKGKTETQRALQHEEREYENHKAKLLNILSDGRFHILFIRSVDRERTAHYISVHMMCTIMMHNSTELVK